MATNHIAIRWTAAHFNTKEDKYILSTKSFGKDKYYIPGGKREPGETDAAALYREIKEELSVELDLSTLQFVGTFRAQAHRHSTGTLVQITCYTAACTGSLKAAAEIEEMVWLSYTDTGKISAADKIIFDFYMQRVAVIAITFLTQCRMAIFSF